MPKYTLRYKYQGEIREAKRELPEKTYDLVALMGHAFPQSCRAVDNKSFTRAESQKFHGYEPLNVVWEDD